MGCRLWGRTESDMTSDLAAAAAVAAAAGDSGKEPTGQCSRHERHWFDPWVGKIPYRRKWQPPPVFLPGESHGQRSLAG